uniref:5'-methylthioadenosine phosphorylase n=1 Tax=uncultured Thiotrichaceae bacterium TaxID=298394 RepID=A0A6S6SL19_9GAMM|nr:MAG: 5'-methylthioadenosine phosphorylase (EC / putative esterase [uncultured Thiotrichaceae bacterium]
MANVSPHLEKWLTGMNALVDKAAKNGFKQTPVNTREGLDNLTRGLTNPRIPMHWVHDDIITPPNAYPVPVRIYHPDKHNELPVLIYYHGGGHMAGGVSLYDPICRKLALNTQHIVVSVEYRLAPECPYPAGLTDAYNAVRFVWPVLDQRQVKYQRSLRIGGDSGGGALSATVAHRAQYDKAVDIDAQLLIYPSLDYTLSQASIDENNEGFLLHTEKIHWYFDHYFQHAEDRKQVSPLFMEMTADYPRTMVVTAEFDPLRDEGQLYVNQLQEAGIDAELLHFDDMIHAFMNMEKLVPDETEQVYTAAGRFLNT